LNKQKLSDKIYTHGQIKIKDFQMEFRGKAKTYQMNIKPTRHLHLSLPDG